ncbi:MAG TPA: hypothetical protein VLF87_03105, partial [Patescibacteria group bacterium]|nr:hypothetical protein [Patescibacteria group bacterium]
EARKYHLDLIVANQFTTQLTEEIRDAVFGNIGTIVSFRIGQVDVEPLSRYFEPIFDGNDLLRIPNHNAVIRTMIGGVPTQPFSMATLPPLGSPNYKLAEALKQLSAAKYGRPKSVVEKEIFDRMATLPEPPAFASANPFKSPAPNGFGGPTPAFGSAPSATPSPASFGSNPAFDASSLPTTPVAPKPAPAPVGTGSFLDEWLAKKGADVPTLPPSPWSKKPNFGAPTPAPAPLQSNPTSVPPSNVPSPVVQSTSEALPSPVPVTHHTGGLLKSPVEPIATHQPAAVEASAATEPSLAKQPHAAAAMHHERKLHPLPHKKAAPLPTLEEADDSAESVAARLSNSPEQPAITPDIPLRPAPAAPKPASPKSAHEESQLPELPPRKKPNEGEINLNGGAHTGDAEDTIFIDQEGNLHRRETPDA